MIAPQKLQDLHDSFSVNRVKRLEEILENTELPDLQKTVLLNCYRNKLQYGCTYPDCIERKLKIFDTVISRYEDPPWWTEFLD